MQVRPWQVRIAVDGGEGTRRSGGAGARARERGAPHGRRSHGSALRAPRTPLRRRRGHRRRAAASAADLPPGERPDARRRARGVRAMAIVGGVSALFVLGGGTWWSAEAANYRKLVYKPLEVSADVTAGHADAHAARPGLAALAANRRLRARSRSPDAPLPRSRAGARRGRAHLHPGEPARRHLRASPRSRRSAAAPTGCSATWSTPRGSTRR